MRRGYTLIEVFITVIVCAVLAAISVPMYDQMVKKHHVNQAAMTLRAIRLAEKMHFSKNGTYACLTVCSGGDAIRTALGVEAVDGKFVYSLLATATAFTATATGYSGTITLNEVGTWGTTGGITEPTY